MLKKEMIGKELSIKLNFNDELKQRRKRLNT
jgi:hypothetical protein